MLKVQTHPEQGSLTFVTVMQNQCVRCRPVSPSGSEQTPQEWQSDDEEEQRRGAALLNMQRNREREERGGARQVSVSGSLSTGSPLAAAVK